MCVVSPAGSVRNRHHHLVARLALRNSGCLRLDISVTYKTFRTRRCGFGRVVLAETLGVEVRLDVAGMAHGGRTRLVIDMASLAVRHAKFGWNGFRRLVASHAIDHLGQRQANQAVAGGDAVVTGGADKFVLIANSEVRRVREFQIYVLT